MQLRNGCEMETDVESLMHQLRAAACGDPSNGLQAMAGPAQRSRRDAMHAQLAEAERHAAVGLTVPRFERYGRAKRALARFVARGVLYVARVATGPQRLVNLALIEALRGALSCLKDEEASRLALQVRVQILERALIAQRTQCERRPSPTHEQGADDGGSDVRRCA